MTSPHLRDLRHCQGLQSHLVDMVREIAESWLRRPLLLFVTSVTVRVFSLTWWTWLGKIPRASSDDLSLSPWPPSLSEPSISPGEHGWGKCQELAPTTSPRLRDLRHCHSLQSHLVNMIGEDAERWLRRPLLVFVTSVTVIVFSLTWWTWLGKMPRVGSDNLFLSPWPPSLHVGVFSLTWCRWTWSGKMPRVGSDDISSSSWPPSLS
jgi:hypothetical protein